jgi:hypothetical protein
MLIKTSNSRILKQNKEYFFYEMLKEVIKTNNINALGRIIIINGKYIQQANGLQEKQVFSLPDDSMIIKEDYIEIMREINTACLRKINKII